MRLKYIGYILLLFILFIGGCGLTEGVIQKESKSYLRFTGNTQEAIVYIDDLAPFKIESESNENSSNKNSNVIYEIASGKHSIIVIKNGE